MAPDDESPPFYKVQLSFQLRHCRKNRPGDQRTGPHQLLPDARSSELTGTGSPPSHDAAGEYVHHKGNIHKSSPRCHIGEIRHPKLIRATSSKLPLRQIPRTYNRTVRYRRAAGSAPNDSSESHAPHQSLHRTAGHRDVFPSTSARRTHVSKVSAVQPILLAIDSIADHCEPCSFCCSNTIRTARSRTSGEYFVVLFMAQSAQIVEPPVNPGDSLAQIAGSLPYSCSENYNFVDIYKLCKAGGSARSVVSCPLREK